jgi:hypothetical protein
LNLPAVALVHAEINPSCLENFNGITALTDDRGFGPVVRELVRYSVKVP